MDENYQRFNEDVEYPNYHPSTNKIPLKSETGSNYRVLRSANLDKFSQRASHLSSTKQNDKNYFNEGS